MIAVLVALSGKQSASLQPATEVGYFQSGSVRIRYAVAGIGEPIVLLHGWMGDASNWGTGPAGSPKLSPPPGYRLIAPDLRGHGGSGKPHTPSAYGPEMARDVIRLLDHLKVKNAHIVSYSMGAFVAGKIVAMAPARVQSVVYGGGAPILDTRTVRGFGDAEAFARAVDSGQGLGAYLQATMPAGSPPLTIQQADQLARLSFASKDVQALAAVGKSFPDLEVPARTLGAHAIPTHFVHGELESGYVRDRVQEALRVIARASIRVLPGRNHVTALRDPDFGKSILDFVRAHPIKDPGLAKPKLKRKGERFEVPTRLRQ